MRTAKGAAPQTVGARRAHAVAARLELRARVAVRADGTDVRGRDDDDGDVRRRRGCAGANDAAVVVAAKEPHAYARGADGEAQRQQHPKHIAVVEHIIIRRMAAVAAAAPLLMARAVAEKLKRPQMHILSTTISSYTG